MSERDSGEEIIEINLDYIDTPHGQVAKIETVEQLAYAIASLSQEVAAIKKYVENVRIGGGGGRVEELEKRLNKIERTLEDIVDRQAVIIDALQELAKTVAEIKKEKI